MKIMVFLLLLIPVKLTGQFMWNFETGIPVEWIESSPGRWTVDSFEAISGNGSLRHSYDNISNGSDKVAVRIIGARPDLAPAAWSFKLRHGYDPSSSNNWAFFLMSDKAPDLMEPIGNVSGYAVGVNLTGYDDILKLYKIEAGAIDEVITSTVNWQSHVGTSTWGSISVSRSSVGEWELHIQDRMGADSLSFYGSEGELFEYNWTGILYRYSSTRDRLLWFDDVSVECLIMEDNDPPKVVGWKLLDQRTIQLNYNESIANTTSNCDDFYFQEPGWPAVTQVNYNSSTLTIYLDGKLINKQAGTLSLGGVCDLNGNCSLIDTLDIIPVWAEEGDIIISEVMYKPEPSVSLPPVEYFELHNRSSYDFNLKEWFVQTSSGDYYFPDTDLKSGGYVVVIRIGDVPLFTNDVPVMGLPSFPSLTDEGRELVIFSDFNIPVHYAHYKPEWHTSTLKQSGGWALELIDPVFPFYFDGNWCSSQDKSGGTPGRGNSVLSSNPDLIAPEINNIFPFTDVSLHLEFSEPMLFPYGLGSFYIGDIEIISLSFRDLFGSSVTLQLSEPLKEKEVHTLSLNGVTDRNGNPPERINIAFGLPLEPMVDEIVFNELLFDPWPGGYDFIELVNTSASVINSSRLLLVSQSGTSSALSDPVLVTMEERLIMPGGYFVITADRSDLLDRYPVSEKSNIFENNKMPSMPDDAGTLYLYRRDLTLLDEVTWKKSMHSQLVNDPEGVSLEKFKPALVSSQVSSWHSASATSGWATPGIVNSVYSEETSGKYIKLSTRVVTPNGDGVDDQLTVELDFEMPGTLYSLLVFTDQGAIVKELALNVVAGTSCSITWDTSDNRHRLVERGIYILFLTGSDLEGRIYRKKVAIAVSR